MLDSKTLIDDLRVDLFTAHSSGQVGCYDSSVKESIDVDRDRARRSLAVEIANEDAIRVTTLTDLKKFFVRC